jgi:hypothetical protein
VDERSDAAGDNCTGQASYAMAPHRFGRNVGSEPRNRTWEAFKPNAARRVRHDAVQLLDHLPVQTSSKPDQVVIAQQHGDGSIVLGQIRIEVPLPHGAGRRRFAARLKNT